MTGTVPGRAQALMVHSCQTAPALTRAGQHGAREKTVAPPIYFLSLVCQMFSVAFSGYIEFGVGPHSAPSIANCGGWYIPIMLRRRHPGNTVTPLWGEEVWAVLTLKLGGSGDTGGSGDSGGSGGSGSSGAVAKAK